MIRSLWTAASGMKAQQTNVDTISNNLANINTTGFKREAAQFKSLLYQTLQDKTTTATGDPKPISAQVGLGVRNSAILSRFTQGALNHTEGQFDLAIQGNGFFRIELPDGNIGYTRNGTFTAAITEGGYTLSTSEGYPVLSVDGEPMVLDSRYDINKVMVNDYGEICYPDATNNAQSIGLRIGLVQFNNPAGLQKTSGSVFVETAASGEAMLEAELGSEFTSTIKQGYLEASNVQAVDEMVNLIVAQRAYEMNSKIITASDEMLQQANNLR